MTTATEKATRLNWSTLRYMQVSPKMLKLRQERPEPETPALRLGRAIHCRILEPGAFDARWVVAGKCAAFTKSTGLPCGSQGSLHLTGNWYCKVKGHAPDGAGPLPDGIEVVTLEDLETAKGCAAAVSGHPVAPRILQNGLPEHSLEWVHPETGIECRGRLDYLKPDGVVDLKSGWGETKREIERAVASRLYYAQLAWYHDGAIAAKRLPADAPLPILIHVQTAEPYDVACFRLSKNTYEAGQIVYRDFIRRFRDCQAADLWPGIAEDMETLELPNYAAGMNGSDYGGAF